MKFTDLQFLNHGFSLEREDGLHVFFPYSKFDFLIADPHTFKMRLEIKKHGTFTRDYETYDALKKDADRLVGKGKE